MHRQQKRSHDHDSRTAQEENNVNEDTGSEEETDWWEAVMALWDGMQFIVCEDPVWPWEQEQDEPSTRKTRRTQSRAIGRTLITFTPVRDVKKRKVSCNLHL